MYNIIHSTAQSTKVSPLHYTKLGCRRTVNTDNKSTVDELKKRWA